ncbi:MAG: SDR family NAD(P)-dependent oxidoreductase, partial [Calditrichaeota bacterium]
MQNCLVTGATGLIGFELCKLLLQHGENVIALSRDADPVRLQSFQTATNFHLLSGDITDRKFTNDIFQCSKIDFVFHMAVERTFANSNDSASSDIQQTAAYKT